MSAACLKAAKEADETASRQEAQAAELAMHVSILQQGIKVPNYLYLSRI